MDPDKILVRRVQDGRGGRAEPLRPDRIPGPVTERFRILSLDGGGTRGAYAAGFLARCEEISGQSAAASFDLIVGTSTGAILGGALAAGCSARDVLDLYRTKGGEIFEQKHRGPLRAKYGHEALSQALDELIGDVTFNDLETALCITALNASAGRMRVFKTPHWNKCYFDRDLPLKEAILASSSAPVYFPGREARDDLWPDAIYVDGGLAANNPALVGISEAFHYLHKDPAQVELLSLGTGGAVRLPKRRIKAGGWLRWREALVARTIDAQGVATHDLLRMVAKKYGAGYYRCSPDDIIDFKLDDLAAIVPLARRGAADADQRQDPLVAAFFTRPTTPIRRHDRPVEPFTRTAAEGSFWYSSRD